MGAVGSYFSTRQWDSQGLPFSHETAAAGKCGASWELNKPPAQPAVSHTPQRSFSFWIHEFPTPEGGSFSLGRLIPCIQASLN